MTVLHVNEKSLTRHYTTLLEQEQHLRKDNNKLRDDFSTMQASVTQRIGYLTRYKVHVPSEMLPYCIHLSRNNKRRVKGRRVHLTDKRPRNNFEVYTFNDWYRE